jgi:DNA helicase-2/ATP-dependent DNA helicase PcrA
MEYYVPILKERFDDYPRRQKELDQLIPMASRYKKLRSFLDDLVLEPPTSSADLDSGEKPETLTLSTVHSAKGLEWPVVFIIWVMEGRFPPARAFNDPLSLEEERRLMYVAATRAKDQLIMCYPGQESVPVWQLSDIGYRNGLSSFIGDLPEDVASRESAGIRKISFGRQLYEKASFDNQLNQRESAGFSQGDRVRHPAFGPGVVSKFVSNDKVEVLFRNAGRKLLHLEYTTLEKI